MNDRISGSMRRAFSLAIFVVACAAVIFSAGGAAAPQSSSGYHVIKKFPVGGEGGWDYLLVDGAAHRIYISRGTHMMVVDSEDGKVIGDLPDTQGIHGIALAHEFNRGYTSNGRSNNVTVFDLKTLKAAGEIATGQNPDAIVYDPATRRVFTFNGRSNDTTAIDAATNTVAGTVALGGRPETGVADGKGRIYVNIEDKSEIVELDSRALKVLNRWPLAPAQEPSGLAMDIAHRRLFAGCANQMMAVMDADSGKVITTLPIGRGVDAAGFDPGTSLAFASNGDGTLTVIREESPDKFSVVENVPTQARARTMSLDPKTHTVYLITAEFGAAPAATSDNPRPRPAMVPNSFVVLVVGR